MKALQIQGSNALNTQREIIRIKANVSTEIAKPLIAGYARVSSDSTDQLNSFSAQVRYYTKLIERHGEWEFAGVYADEGTTGVSTEKRDDFNLLKSILSLFTHPYALIVDGLLIVGLISFVIYRLINVQKNKNIFRKLNLQGNEIEIFEESDDSYFDKYLNEVLYLFENADANVIVFEDMDRFNANRIFERLREVNTLANIQLKKDNKKVLRFFYLLRDDIFVSKDRTKFFDYIVPVVPVVDSSNAYDQFISHFKKSGLYEKFDESFLQGLSLYIDDMRLLKNIYNEFLVYYNRLNTIELDCNRMLALIAYKNLFPRDFADLQLNQGFLFTLFNNRDTFIAQETQRLNQLISKKKNDIEMANNECLETLHELDVVFEEKKPTDYYGRKRELSQEEDIVYLNARKVLKID